MKRIITVLLAIMVLASCSTKFSLVKRKYNKGYFVSTSKPCHQNENKLAVHKGKVKVEVKNEVEAEVKNEVKGEAKLEVQNSTIETEQIAVKEKHQLFGALRKKANVKQDVDRSEAVAMMPISKKAFFGKSKTKAPSGGDEADIVTIILCIFIPPLAVYLVKNSIDKNFWLDLVLTILVWVPGVVFALLYCFADVHI